jgi:hypothetical protein
MHKHTIRLATVAIFVFGLIAPAVQRILQRAYRQARGVAVGNKVRSGGGNTIAADATFRNRTESLELTTFDTTVTLVDDEAID